jgi:penicillin-binding protein 2
MPVEDTNLAGRSGSLVESHKGYDLRVISFYFGIAALLLTLLGGLIYQQLLKTETYNERERVQSQRRVLVPGPRGIIYARDGTTVLVGNRPRLSVVLYLDELKPEFFAESRVITRNYAKAGKDMALTRGQISRIARVSVVQRYLDQVNKILLRDERVDPKSLGRHFDEQLLLPYPLLENLSENDYAKLIESLPVRSPLQVYTSSTRYYPYGSAAAHALGYVRSNEDVTSEDFPGEDLATFKMKNTVGKNGLEKTFENELQGEAGGTIFRVDPSGYKVNPPLEKRLPVQGKNIVTSIDIDLQLAAEQAIGDQVGAAVALDVNTGEVLTLVSKPDYNLSDFSPRVTSAVYAEIQAKGAELNRAVQGSYPPGSTFKILTSIAALRAGALTPGEPIIDCDAVLVKNNRRFVCYNGTLHHHNILLRAAVAESCDIYYYEAGWRTTPDVIAAEARRFGFGRRTGIELPHEHALFVPDDAWKRRTQGEKWYPGDTANMAIGQGFVEVTPLQMACFVASVARGEISTRPTLLHQPNRPPQHTEPIGLTPDQRAALIAGMEDCTLPPHGTARIITTTEALRIPGLRIAGKTGTAQKRVTIDGKTGNINFAWFICFAPVEKPEIAIAVMLEGDTPGEEYGGGRNAGPVAAMIMKKYFEKKANPGPAPLQFLRKE